METVIPNAAAEDQAIVVGVSNYPELGDLKGPENDATDFCDWLRTQASLPEQNIHAILSSQFGPLPRTVLEARPTNQAIAETFNKLQEDSRRHEKQFGSRRIGRRLYIYLAGHGFSPNSEEVALLMANATQEQIHHVPARVYANYFVHSGAFEQVVLFMDCCRDPYGQVPLWLLPYVTVLDRTAIDHSKILCGFAAKWTHRTREKAMSDQRIRGIFSHTLLTALKGAACEQSGEITARSLADFTYNEMKKLISPKERRSQGVSLEPEFVYDTNPQSRFVIIKLGKPSTFPVTLHLRPEHVGKYLQILGVPLFPPIVHERIQAPLPGSGGSMVWRGRLEAGTYLCQVLETGHQNLLVVNGLEAANVEL